MLDCRYVGECCPFWTEHDHPPNSHLCQASLLYFKGSQEVEVLVGMLGYKVVSPNLVGVAP